MSKKRTFAQWMRWMRFSFTGAPCLECGGTKVCSTCYGAGMCETGAGEIDCPDCEASCGICQVCGGTGLHVWSLYQDQLHQDEQALRRWNE